MQPKFIGTIKNGALKLDSSGKFKAYISRFEGKRIELTLGPIKHSKTLQQLRYVHGVVFNLIADECGYDTIDPIKNYLCDKYLEKRTAVSTKRDKSIEYTPSLADVKKDEMMIFIEKCVQWAAKELGVVVPDPSQVVF